MPNPISDCSPEASFPAADDESVSCDSPPEASSRESSDHVTCYEPPYEHSVPVPPSGTGDDQLQQALHTTDLAIDAGLAEIRGEPYGSNKAREVLPGLKLTAPIPGQKTSTAEYQSHLRGVSPDQAFQHFTHNLSDVFGAAGLRLYPPVKEVHDGDRVMLHDPAAAGPPPRPAVWAPIEIGVDPKTRTVHITTLDGHPIRGTNQFCFGSDGGGGTVLRQYSAFQASSAFTNAIGQASGAMERQQEIWKAVHTRLGQPDET
jgi:hypothetical protein